VPFSFVETKSKKLRIKQFAIKFFTFSLKPNLICTEKNLLNRHYFRDHKIQPLEKFHPKNTATAIAVYQPIILMTKYIIFGHFRENSTINIFDSNTMLK
jgi:hypothetical protein